MDRRKGGAKFIISKEKNIRYKGVQTNFWEETGIFVMIEKIFLKKDPLVTYF